MLHDYCVGSLQNLRDSDTFLLPFTVSASFSNRRFASADSPFIFFNHNISTLFFLIFFALVLELKGKLLKRKESKAVVIVPGRKLFLSQNIKSYWMIGDRLSIKKTILVRTFEWETIV